VTPKTLSRQSDSLTPLSAPFYVMLLLAVAGYLSGGVRWAADPIVWDTVVVCSLWNTFNLLLTLCCLGVVWERRQLRRSHRYATREPAVIRRPGSAAGTPAILTDISTTGVGLITEDIMEIPDGRLIIEARDSGQREYTLPVRVTRQDIGPAGMSLGCEFEPPDEAARAQIVGFVYGDSNRWKYFHEVDIGKAVGSFKGLFNLLSAGAQGALRNLTGMVRIFLDFLTGFRLNSPKIIPMDKRGERHDETSDDAAPSVLVPGSVSRYGRGGHPSNPIEKVGAGSGSPAQGVDGQLQLHHSHSRTLEGHQGDSPFQLR
jgi:cellulose synthase (UDP-forming)